MNWIDFSPYIQKGQLILNPDGEGFILGSKIPVESLAKIKELNSQYKSKYGENIVFFEELKTAEDSVQWKESDHPRDDDGKFSSSNGAHGTEQQEKNEKEVSSTGRGQTPVEFHSGEEGNSFFYKNPNYKKWFESLSEVTKKIIKDYTLDRAADINAQLRENNLKGFYKKAVESIDRAISNFVLNEPIRVYRALEETLEEEIGELYKEEGYASSTCNKSAAEERSGLILVMDIPAGEGNGAYINELSHYKDKEYEFLIKRNSQFRVSGKEKKNGKTYIHMEMEN